MQKRKFEVLGDEENLNASQKRRLGNPNFGKMTEFVLNTLEELEETEKGNKKKILELAMNEDKFMIKFWGSVRTEERKEQVRRFIQFTNLMFDIVSIKILYFLLHDNLHRIYEFSCFFFIYRI